MGVAACLVSVCLFRGHDAVLTRLKGRVVNQWALRMLAIHTVDDYGALIRRHVEAPLHFDISDPRALHRYDLRILHRNYIVR